MSSPAEPWLGRSPARNALRDAARERILAAARTCAARDGLPAIGIAGVAAEAGISRPTVYRYFDDRSDLVEQTVLRAAADFADGIREAIARHEDAGAQAVEALIHCVRALPVDPILGPALSEPGWLAGLPLARALPFVRHALEPVALAADWNDADAQEASEVWFRFALSLLTATGPARNDAALRGFCRRRLIPALAL